MRQLVAVILSVIVCVTFIAINTTSSNANAQTDNPCPKTDAENQNLRELVECLESRVKALELSLDGLSIKVVTGKTMPDGLFEIEHKIDDFKDIVGATFAVERKSREGREISAQTTDNKADDGKSSDNWLYWNSQFIKGGILNSDWAGQLVTITIFYKE